MEPWYRLAVVIISPLFWLLFRADLRGREHLPRDGGVSLAANHISLADPFVVALFVHTAKRRPRFMAKHSVFRIPVAGRIVRGAKQIPVYRNTADAGAALRAAVDAIEALLLETGRLRKESARLGEELEETRRALERSHLRPSYRLRERVVRRLQRSGPGRAALAAYRAARGRNSRSA